MKANARPRRAMLTLARRTIAAAACCLALTCFEIAGAQEAAWTIVLHPKDFVIGSALTRLKTRRSWIDRFDDRTGNFEIAVSKTAVPIAAPQCRMDYLIMTIPMYYPENPKQASIDERRAIYESLVEVKGSGGTVTMHVEAPLGLARTRAGRTELAACNLYFALPLAVQFSRE